MQKIELNRAEFLLTRRCYCGDDDGLGHHQGDGPAFRMKRRARRREVLGVRGRVPLLRLEQPQLLLVQPIFDQEYLRHGVNCCERLPHYSIP